MKLSKVSTFCTTYVSKNVIVNITLNVTKYPSEVLCNRHLKICFKKLQKY